MTTELSTMNLSELESIVERGLASFIEVGNALIEIRDAATPKTFPCYRETGREAKSFLSSDNYVFVTLTLVAGCTSS